jgi:5'-3' exonuclease
MGIKHFFTWFRREFPEALLKTHPRFDHVLIDMNGIIHEAAQYIYKYGPYENKRMLGRNVKPPVTKLVNEIKKRVNAIVELCKPNKSVYLAVDGVAPMSKQNQQRQRRFKATADRKDDDDSFDSNCITAGTDFIKEVCGLLQPPYWVKSRGRPVEISTDAEPGEGEHKLVDKIRQSQDNGETHCVVGLDADLIMLSLLLDREVYIMRGDKFIDINIVSRTLNKIIPLEDFIVLSCMVGNDFLPPIPTIAIKDGGLKLLMDIYGDVGKPLVVNHRIQIRTLVKILTEFSDYEQDIMELRAGQNDRFPNPMWKGDINEYRKEFLEKKFDEPDPKEIVKRYIAGLQWVYRYYKFCIPSWDWFYPFHYTPHASNIASHANKKIVEYRFRIDTEPSTSDDQLLRVIPPASRHLLKKSLWDKHKSLPTRFEIDLAGKHEEWEAVVIVDFIKL